MRAMKIDEENVKKQNKTKQKKTKQNKTKQKKKKKKKKKKNLFLAQTTKSVTTRDTERAFRVDISFICFLFICWCVSWIIYFRS